MAKKVAYSAVCTSQNYGPPRWALRKTRPDHGSSLLFIKILKESKSPGTFYWIRIEHIISLLNIESRIVSYSVKERAAPAELTLKAM